VAIEDTYREVLRGLGNLAEILEVSVGPDDFHGTVARVRLKLGPNGEPGEIAAKVAEILGLYTTSYCLEFIPN